MTQDQRKEKLETLISHIETVQKNCQLLGNRLIEAGEFEFGKRLIANGFLHDASKFRGLEWAHLTRPDPDDELVPAVIQHHVETNLHHPEAWQGIKNMPQLYVAEMCCDWFARSNELGKDFRLWIETTAFKKWQFSRRDRIYRDIMRYVGMLIEPSL